VTRSHSALARRAARAAFLAALFALLGCGKNDGLSDNDRRMLNIQQAAESLKGKGAKIQERSYPQGNAWAVDASGMQVNEELLRELKSLGNISELNLSKSTLGDEHMALFNELGLGTLALKLDLSHTAITDAGFEKLDNLRLLSQLNLTGTKVTPAAVERFRTKRLKDERVWERFRRPTIKMK